MQEQMVGEFTRWDKMSTRQKRLALAAINPVFKVSAVKLPGRGNTRITVEEMQLNLGGEGGGSAITLDLRSA
jgi:hypothetical protein